MAFLHGRPSLNVGARQLIGGVWGEGKGVANTIQDKTRQEKHKWGKGIPYFPVLHPPPTLTSTSARPDCSGRAHVLMRFGLGWGGGGMRGQAFGLVKSPTRARRRGKGKNQTCALKGDNTISLEEIKTKFLYCCNFGPIQRRHTYF